MGKTNRRGVAARQRAGFEARNLSQPYSENRILGEIVGVSGLGDVDSSESTGIKYTVKIKNFGTGEIWSSDPVSVIYSLKGAGNLIGSTVVVTYLGGTFQDMKRGRANLVAHGSLEESFEHPDVSSPVSVGGFHGCGLSKESHRVFAGRTPGITGETK